MATPDTQRHLPGRSAARKATAAAEEQLMNSPVRSETEGHRDSPFGDVSPLRNKGKTKVTYKTKGKRSPVRSSPPKLQPAPAARPPPKTSSPRKRHISISDDELSPLSSCGSTPVVQTPGRNGAARHSQASPKSSPSRVSGVHNEASTPSHPAVRRGRRAAEEPWEAAKLGTFVWVLVDKRARGVEGGDEDGGYSPDLMWWPARITSPSSSSVPLFVSLIGEMISRTPTVMEITLPSAQNILSMLSATGDLRFSESDFIPSPIHDPLQSSPRKKKKRDITGIKLKWRAAVEDLVHQHDEENDGLPQAGEAYGSFYGTLSFNKGNSLSPGKSKNSPTKGKPPRGEHMEDINADPWLPPPCDPTLTIPGELVLAREKKESSVYWPAKIEAYVPPDKPSKPGRYAIVFFDTVQAVIPRELFFTSDEDGFGTCKLGRWESSYEDVLNDKEGQEVGEDTQDLVRSPSPPSGPPSSSHEFCDLPIPQQFSYVKPVLVAILNEGYAPAKQRHTNFIKGGALRRGVAENAGARGLMSPADVEELQRCLLKWALRDERRAKRMVEDEMPDNGRLTLEGHTKTRDRPGDRTSKPIVLNEGASPSPVPSPLTSLDESAVDIPSSQIEIPPSSEPSSPPRNNTSVQESGLNDIRPEDESTIPRPENAAGDRGPDIIGNYRPPPRQRGCEAYEVLSGIERIEYCSNVLLPEAILQILLWRSGERSSLELLSPEEEAALYEISIQKSEERDWVHDVVRLREAKGRTLKKQASSLSVSVGGTRSRPKRIVRT